LYGLFTGIVILVVILFVAPLFKTLPYVNDEFFDNLVTTNYVGNFFVKACLAGSICIALRLMCLEFKNLPRMYKKSKAEAVSYFI
jgi:hypothetical protein